ncbi:uncharacterized protein LOC122851750 [Aphidius gifuensis]|uniref:uncharacterized protein LOC122851750 n=1 Tax=Aphidius gifuensis TaxID=684658 RepID=UPI001CDCEE11|nr:uncharacterized protein LOC122851750 [Aphidius gifuensis]
MSAKRICVEEDQQISNDDDKDQKVVINSLDYDSLAKIFMLLPVPERIDMEEVCVKWKEACQRAWYDIKKYKCELSIGRCYDNRLLTQSYIEKILLRCGIYLKELSLSNICNSSIIPFVGDHCKNLTSLECDVSIRSLIHDADLLVQAFTQLNKLKSLTITVNHSYYKETVNLSEIINSLPEDINEIHLLSETPYNKKRTISMTLKKFKNLQKLTIHGPCSRNIFYEIAEKTTLVHLTIGLHDKYNRLSLFNKLVNLEYIDLTMGFKYRVYNLSTDVLDNIFCTCKNLKHLDIVCCPYDVAKIPLEKWINLPKLQYLAISCTIMPDLANKIVQYCKDLKVLRIHQRMNDTALKKLTELENLECLSLFDNKELSKESIIAISNNCKKLKCLEIPGCLVVPSASLDDLSKLQYLEHLNLCGVINLGSSAITAIANHCKNLKILEIRGCTAITETALVALTKLENLQKLDVSFLDITDSSISKFKELKILYCVDCKKLTDDGIIQLIKNNPDLEEINIYGIDNITYNLVIYADKATKNRINGIILHMTICDLLRRQLFNSMITSQWLVVEDMDDQTYFLMTRY